MTDDYSYFPLDTTPIDMQFGSFIPRIELKIVIVRPQADDNNSISNGSNDPEKPDEDGSDSAE